MSWKNWVAIFQIFVSIKNNGEKETALEVNCIFRGVMLTKGKHTISFNFF